MGTIFCSFEFELFQIFPIINITGFRITFSPHINVQNVSGYQMSIYLLVLIFIAAFSLRIGDSRFSKGKGNLFLSKLLWKIYSVLFHLSISFAFGIVTSTAVVQLCSLLPPKKAGECDGTPSRGCAFSEEYFEANAMNHTFLSFI